MSEQTGRKLNNAQRKAIAKVKEEQLAELIKEAKTALADRRRELLELVKEELGVAKTYDDIRRYGEYIRNGKEQLREAGLETYSENSVMPGGKVDLRLSELTGSESKRVQELMGKRTEIALAVWEAETTADLPEIPE